MTPILLLGAGRMGGALIEGWGRAQAFDPRSLIIRDPFPGEAALNAAQSGARLNPPEAALGEARTVLMAVKPQSWRQAVADVAPQLLPDTVIVSIAAGVPTADLAQVFKGHPIARVMPTTGVAIAKGVPRSPREAIWPAPAPMPCSIRSPSPSILTTSP